MQFQKTPGWLDWYAGPSTPRFMLPSGAVDAHCHVFGPGAEFPYAPTRKYTPCDASKQQLYALRRPSRLCPQRGRAGHLSRRRQPRDARCARPFRRQSARRRHRRARRQRRRIASHARRRRSRRAFQFHQAPGRFHAKGRVDGNRRPRRGARLACRDLFRAGRLAGVAGFLHRLADDPRRRPHGTARCDQAGRRTGVRTVHEIHGPASQRLVQGQLPGTAVRRRAARARTASATPIATSSRSRAASSKIFQTGCCGAPTGRIPICGTTCPTTACWSISSRTSP